MTNQNETKGSDRVAIVGYYSTGSAPSLEGTAEGLLELAAQLESPKSTIEMTLIVPANRDPDPYERFLHGMRLVKQEQGPVKVSLYDAILEISGGLEAIKILAENIRWLCTEKSANHLHI